MGKLVDESLDFIANNIKEIVTLPIDMNCMNSSLIKKLAVRVNIEVLD